MPGRERPRVRGGPRRPRRLRDGPAGVTAHQEGWAEKEEDANLRAGDAAPADLTEKLVQTRRGWGGTAKSEGWAQGVTVLRRPGRERQKRSDTPAYALCRHNHHGLVAVQGFL